MVRVAPERLRHDLLQFRFDVIDGLARRQPRPVAHPVDVGVDGEGLFAERRVEYDVCRLAADAWKLLQLFARARHLPAMMVDQRLAEQDDVFCLGVEQADRLDRVAQLVFAQLDHLPRRSDMLEQGPGRDVDARIGRLGRKHDGDQQLIRISGFELRGWRGVGLGQSPEEFENLLALHRASITSRIE